MEVGPGGGVPGPAARVCAPAWRPDGELTFIRGGDVVTAGGEVLVRDLTCRPPLVLLAATRDGRALAWLTDTRLAAILRGRSRFGGGDLLVFAEGDRAFSGGEVGPAGPLVDRSQQEVWIAHPGDDFSPPG